MHPAVIVFLGAGLGGVLRHLVNQWVPRLFGTGFPFATFVVNVSGSFIMGLVIGYLAFKDGEHWTQSMRLFLTTGVLGGYTTFSTFSLDFFFLMERGEHTLAAAYVIGSVAIAFLGVYAGMALMRTMS
ncbi:fluoride efflux transporter CrcB [Xanthobacter tagetidis]|jgi:CrcB protein|uniref:Fluoride-specific ion channel FluC n=1 Tax=Xanthobacter tagetidis TaxID=60216 RepID=A0A3L7AB41_9HYPH|nr:fluoride efflux transporter CrcB [Xanthobacter tagetidis]MBB6309636.1 CrcB protein [Xanthobacter tagetidis]RLP77184.1 fluoride efflux transporter CrcB [Xanthobacter tagetidis]